MSRAPSHSPAFCRPRVRRLGPVWPFSLALALTAATGLLACSGKGASSAASDRGKRDTKIRRESCSKGAGFDTNRDGKNDLFEVTTAGKLACRASDLDFDGVVDQTTFFDAAGVVRRREVDFDGDGIPNLVETYKDGKLTLREIDGASLGKFDMWDSYDPATGARTRRERDTNGDGRIDQYWSFAGARITVRFDRNDDGVPDDEGVLVWGEGFESAATADAGAAPLAQSWLDAGTETPQQAPEGDLTDAGLTKPAHDGGAQ